MIGYYSNSSGLQSTPSGLCDAEVDCSPERVSVRNFFICDWQSAVNFGIYARLAVNTILFSLDCFGECPDIIV